MSVEAPPNGQGPAPEDQARANFYGLLARLFQGPPDEELLRSLASAADLEATGSETQLAQAWKALKDAAARTDARSVHEEYESVFIGTGKAEVTLYTGAYATRSPSRNSLVLIRDFLSRHSLGRKESVNEPEDHIAAMCEVMRHIVSRGDAAAQREFFFEFLQPGAPLLCDAIANCKRTNFYKSVAQLAGCFLEIEHSAMNME